MITFLLFYYAITGFATSGSLLTNKETNNSKTDIALCVIAGLLWPIALTIFSTALFYTNVKDIYQTRREKQLDQLLRFIRPLHKLGLISRLSLLQIVAIANSKHQ